MAINKRKILQSAQKFLQKGALDKALKDYQTLLKADPRDVNIRLKVGDIHLKQGKTDDAVAAYLKVAERFMGDGFDAKAVALYKQITKIDPKRHDIYVPLAELYQRLGLNSDAMKALQTAADAHYREGEREEALDLLRKMAALDPSNTVNRIKVADLLHQEGRNAEAIAEFVEVAAEFERQGDVEERVRILKRIVEVDPECLRNLVVLGRTMLEHRDWNLAEAIARQLMEKHAQETDGYEILCEALEHSGRSDECPDVYRQLAELYKERGDDGKARDIMQRFGAPDSFTAEVTEEPVFSDEDLPAAPSAAETSLDTAMDDFPVPADAPSQPPAPPAAAPVPRAPVAAPAAAVAAPAAAVAAPAAAVAAPAAARPEPGPIEGDPEQLLAEASVYLRYGKHERAIESLRAVIGQEPGHRQALEKLGEAFASSGDAASAVAAYSNAAERAREEGDDAACVRLRAQIAEIDPSAAPGAQAAPADAPAAAEASAPAPDLDLGSELDPDEVSFGDVDIEIDPGLPDEEPELPDPEPVIEVGGVEFEFEESSESDTPAAEESYGGDLDIELDVGDDLSPELSEADESSFEAEPEELSALESEPEPLPEPELPPAPEIALHDEPELSIDPDIVAAASAAAPSPAAPEAPPAPSGPSLTTPSSLVEELEEADFYFQQAMYSEARVIYERIVAVAPNHPQAMLRLGEIEAAAAAPPQSEPVAAPEVALPDVAEEDLQDLSGDSLDLPLDEEIEFDEAADSRDLSGDALDVPVEDTTELVSPSEDDFEIPDDFSTDDLGLPMDDEGIAAADDELAIPEELSGEGLEDEGVDPGEDTAPAAPPVQTEPVVPEPEPVPPLPEPVSAEVSAPEPAAVEPVPEPVIAAPEPPPAVAAPVAAPEPEAAPEIVEPPVAAALPQADVTAPSVPNLPMPPRAPGGDFDLAAQLSGAFDESEAGPSAKSGGTEAEGFEQVFAAFKAGVQEELGDGDYEAHYDLGIAYKEMGLYEDAIGEFRNAMGSPTRKLSCLHMMGLCALDLDRVPDGVAHLEQALALPDVPADQQIGLRFDLGRAYALQGDAGRARESFEAVQSLDADFCDVADHLQALDDGSAAQAEAAADGEAFESFDDLIEGEAPQAQAEPAPQYESFDDLMGDDGEEGEGDDDPSTATAEPETPAGGKKKRGGRRKKISFV